MNLTHVIALILAIAGPLLLILGLDLLLAIADYLDGRGAQTPASGTLDSTDSRFRRIPVALPDARD